jgi:hypothetical protein
MSATISYESPAIERREDVRGLLTRGSYENNLSWKLDWKD